MDDRRSQPLAPSMAFVPRDWGILLDSLSSLAATISRRRFFNAEMIGALQRTYYFLCELPATGTPVNRRRATSCTRQRLFCEVEFINFCCTETPCGDSMLAIEFGAIEPASNFLCFPRGISCNRAQDDVSDSGFRGEETRGGDAWNCGIFRA